MDKQNKKYYINDEIKSNKVRCIDQNNENIGVVSIAHALNLAQIEGLDLVQIYKQKNKIPVCKIIDYGKYKYEISKREKYQAKKRRESIIKIKEIKFKPNININDLKIKAKQCIKFLSQGHKVKISVVMKGRESSHKDLIIDKINSFTLLVSESEQLKTYDVKKEECFGDYNMLAMLFYAEHKINKVP